MNHRFWLQILLVISLAFNIAFIGMHCFMPPPHPPHGPEAFEERITRDMSESDAMIVHKAFDAHKPEFSAERKEMDAAIGNVRRVLSANSLNQDELKKMMDQAHSVRTESEHTMEQVMLEAAKDLSPDGRDKLVPPPPPSPMGDH